MLCSGRNNKTRATYDSSAGFSTLTPWRMWPDKLNPIAEGDGSEPVADCREHSSARVYRHWLLCLFVGMLDQVGRQFFQKGRRMTGHQLPILFAPGAVAYAQRLHRSGDADVKQAPLLIHRAFDL
jgi:hypothetical protein